MAKSVEKNSNPRKKNPNNSKKWHRKHTRTYRRTKHYAKRTGLWSVPMNKFFAKELKEGPSSKHDELLVFKFQYEIGGYDFEDYKKNENMALKLSYDHLEDFFAELDKVENIDLFPYQKSLVKACCCIQVFLLASMIGIFVASFFVESNVAGYLMKGWSIIGAIILFICFKKCSCSCLYDKALKKRTHGIKKVIKDWNKKLFAEVEFYAESGEFCGWISLKDQKANYSDRIDGLGAKHTGGSQKTPMITNGYDNQANDMPIPAYGQSPPPPPPPGFQNQMGMMPPPVYNPYNQIGMNYNQSTPGDMNYQGNAEQGIPVNQNVNVYEPSPYQIGNNQVQPMGDDNGKEFAKPHNGMNMNYPQDPNQSTQQYAKP